MLFLTLLGGVLDPLRCKTLARVRRELWGTLRAYNLSRKVIATAAAPHHPTANHGNGALLWPARASWPPGCSGPPGPAATSPQLWRLALARRAANQVANRPGRIEPRALRRRRHR